MDVGVDNDRGRYALNKKRAYQVRVENYSSCCRFFIRIQL